MLYHELENINEAEDSKDELNHIPISSPIALFINTLSGDLKVFAIQWDSHQGNDNIQVKIRNKWETKKLTYNTDTNQSDIQRKVVGTIQNAMLTLTSG